MIEIRLYTTKKNFKNCVIGHITHFRRKVVSALFDPNPRYVFLKIKALERMYENENRLSKLKIFKAVYSRFYSTNY